VQLTIRPLPAWPYEPQPIRPATYKVGYSRTLRDLEYELVQIGASSVLVGLVVDERDVRLDGRLRADARVRYDGVELSFDKPVALLSTETIRITFHTDRHRGYRESWQDNLRAITLGLEALRAVDRYGITSTGEQYAGFAQLAAGGPSADRGKALVEQAGSIRDALRKHHPDHGGSERDFVDVQAYRKAVGL
jgi:hypothetical protein